MELSTGGSIELMLKQLQFGLNHTFLSPGELGNGDISGWKIGGLVKGESLPMTIDLRDQASEAHFQHGSNSSKMKACWSLW